MSGRNTTTGRVLEAMVIPALTRGGYTCEKEALAARARGSRPYQVGVIVISPLSLPRLG